MTPTERAILKKQQRAIKLELGAKLEHGDITAMAQVGNYHYNSYRNFFDNESDWWSDGVHEEALKYFMDKETAIANS